MYRDLDFNGPLNDERAIRLIHSLGPLENHHIADVGCGWAELLLRTLATEPTTTGSGIDLSEDYIRLGRANAETRGLADRHRYARVHGQQETVGSAYLTLLRV